MGKDKITWEMEIDSMKKIVGDVLEPLGDSSGNEQKREKIDMIRDLIFNNWGFRHSERQLGYGEGYLYPGQKETLWPQVLDSPLIAHFDAGLHLQEKGYDGMITMYMGKFIEPSCFSQILRLTGIPNHSIDNDFKSRGKEIKKGDNISEESLDRLKDKNKVFIVGHYIVTESDTKNIINFLRDNEVNVKGIYCGLSTWDDSRDPHEDKTEYRFSRETVSGSFWEPSENGLVYLRKDLHEMLLEKDFLPEGLEVFSANTEFNKGCEALCLEYGRNDPGDYGENIDDIFKATLRIANYLNEHFKEYEK